MQDSGFVRLERSGFPGKSKRNFYQHFSRPIVADQLKVLKVFIHSYSLDEMSIQKSQSALSGCLQRISVHSSICHRQCGLNLAETNSETFHHRPAFSFTNFRSWNLAQFPTCSLKRTNPDDLWPVRDSHAHRQGGQGQPHQAGENGQPPLARLGQHQTTDPVHGFDGERWVA